MRTFFKCALALGTLLAPLPAFAGSIILDIDHCTGRCGTTPFGTINAQGADASRAQFVISLTSGEFVFTGQAASTFAFNIIGDRTISVANASLAGWNLDSPTAGSLHAGGGIFEYSLNCCSNLNGGSNAQAGPISFDIVNGSGALSPASFLQSSGGSRNVNFPVDILSATKGDRGFVGIGPRCTDCIPVPEPASLPLLGVGISGLALLIRRRRQQATYLKGLAGRTDFALPFPEQAPGIPSLTVDKFTGA